DFAPSAESPPHPGRAPPFRSRSTCREALPAHSRLPHCKPSVPWIRTFGPLRKSRGTVASFFTAPSQKFILVYTTPPSPLDQGPESHPGVRRGVSRDGIQSNPACH